MTASLADRIKAQHALRERLNVFRDRGHGGEILACMLMDRYRSSNAIVLAVPAGGVPVAGVMADRLALSLDVAVVSKITLPWNQEAGYGAVAFDGTVLLNEPFLARLPLSEREIQEGVDRTRQKVLVRAEKFRGREPLARLGSRPAILVDDGLASGFTLLTAVEALRRADANHIVIAVPTGHEDSLRRVAREVDAVYCANVRTGRSFAVADAYENWSDVDEEEAIRIFRIHASSVHLFSGRKREE